MDWEDGILSTFVALRWLHLSFQLFLATMNVIDMTRENTMTSVLVKDSIFGAREARQIMPPPTTSRNVLGNEVSRADNTGRGKHYEEVRKHASKKGELCDINLAMEKGNDGDDELGRIPVASQYALACTWMDPTYPNEVFKNDPSHFPAALLRAYILGGIRYLTR
ncbi:hypothetical protein B0H10DRAFT_2196934 [Mycena sp. CBHHK59/15]|nr:hypothetical protein B0H10DRAFT_2196934 [Mycena sp. CBHHK59/15]